MGHFVVIKLPFAKARVGVLAHIYEDKMDGLEGWKFLGQRNFHVAYKEACYL